MKKVLLNAQYHLGILFFLLLSSKTYSQNFLPKNESIIWYNALGRDESCLYYLYYEESSQNFLIIDENRDTIVCSKVFHNFVDEKPLSFKIDGSRVIVTRHTWKKKLFRKEEHIQEKFIFNHY